MNRDDHFAHDPPNSANNATTGSIGDIMRSPSLRRLSHRDALIVDEDDPDRYVVLTDVIGCTPSARLLKNPVFLSRVAATATVQFMARFRKWYLSRDTGTQILENSANAGFLIATMTHRHDVHRMFTGMDAVRQNNAVSRTFRKDMLTAVPDIVKEHDVDSRVECFLKFRLRSSADDLVIDSLMGLMVNQALRSMAMKDAMRYAPHFMSYMDSFLTYVVADQGLHRSSSGIAFHWVLPSIPLGAPYTINCASSNFRSRAGIPHGHSIVQCIVSKAVIEAVSLKDLCKSGNLRGEDLLRLFRAMRAMYTMTGMIHNDAHTSNVLLDQQNDRLVLIDYGMCTMDFRKIESIDNGAIMKMLDGATQTLAARYVTPGAGDTSFIRAYQRVHNDSVNSGPSSSFISAQLVPGSNKHVSFLRDHLYMYDVATITAGAFRVMTSKIERQPEDVARDVLVLSQTMFQIGSEEQDGSVANMPSIYIRVGDDLRNAVRSLCTTADLGPMGMAMLPGLTWMCATLALFAERHGKVHGNSWRQLVLDDLWHANIMYPAFQYLNLVPQGYTLNGIAVSVAREYGDVIKEAIQYAFRKNDAFIGGGVGGSDHINHINHICKRMRPSSRTQLALQQMRQSVRNAANVASDVAR